MKYTIEGFSQEVALELDNLIVVRMQQKPLPNVQIPQSILDKIRAEKRLN